MAFWTSNEPGVLPKWIFWLFSASAVLNLIILGILPSSQISTEDIAAFLASALTAGLARINAVKVLVGINAVACLVAITGTLIVFLAVDLQSKAGGAVSAIMIGYAAFSVWWVWYLNLYRAKPSTTNKVARPPADSYPVAKSYSPPQPRSAGSAPSEKQLAERGIFDIEHGGTPEEASPDDYAIELGLFESGDLDQSLWAKHLVEAEGDADKAKWRYIKARVNTAPARRAEQEKEKKEEEMRAFVEAERLKEERLAAERKAAFEAIHRRIELEVAQEEAAKEAERQRIELEVAQEEAAKEAERQRIELEMAEREIAAKAERDALRKRRIEARRRRIAAAWNVFSDTLVLANTNRGWSATIVLVFVVGPLIFFNLLPEEEARAANLINESWWNFVGDRGVVDEELAISQIGTALSLIADRSTPEATELRGYAYNNLGVYRACAADQKFRDKKASKQAYRSVIDTNHYFMQQALWSVFWGELPADTINTPAQHNLLTDLMRDWAPIQFRERHPEKTPLEVLKLLDKKRSEVSLLHYAAAERIAFFYECRAEQQDIGLAVEWYQTALERLPSAPEPVSADQDSSLTDDQREVLNDVSAALLAEYKRQNTERLRRLRLVMADQRR